jgi:hypothetical protein
LHALCRGTLIVLGRAQSMLGLAAFVTRSLQVTFGGLLDLLSP